MTIYTPSTLPEILYNGDVINIDYTGTKQQISLPKGKFKLECWGAQGGDTTYGRYANYGGKGGYSKGTIELSTVENLFLYTGGKGVGISGGFNGGGNSIHSGTDGGGGGGSTDIRINSDSLYSRLIVAGAGGGGCGYAGSNGAYNGYWAGGLKGYPLSASSNDGQGGSETSGGACATSYPGTGQTAGAFGIGGNAGGGGYGGGAGGAGWYGGGGSTYILGRGAGGSSFVWKSGVAVPSGYTPDTSLYLTATQLIDGNSTITNPDGTTATGKSGNGYIRITVLDTPFVAITNRTVTIPATQYTYIDLNRVCNNMQYLADLLTSYGYKVTVNTKTDWTQISIPFDDLMTTYLANVQALVDVYCTMPNTPSLPSVMQNLTWQSANSIEQNLADINTLLGYMIAQFSFSNTIYSGE